MKRVISLVLALTAAGFLFPADARAGADEEWEAILLLDAGPKQKPRSADEAGLLARNHFLVQRRALENFLKTRPGDPRAAQARIRLADIKAAEGMMDGNRRAIAEALELFERVAADPAAGAKDRADAAFRRASVYMQTISGGPEKNAAAVAAAAQSFADKFPSDPREARLLAEAATVCDSRPELKRGLLERALAATREDEIRLRVTDDLKRLDRLGKPLELTLPGLDGGTIDVPALRGKPVLLVFWASHSPQSLLWLRDFRQAFEKLPAGSLRVVTFNLDPSRQEARKRAQALNADWPTAWEPGGWDAPTARALGINALPTVWFIDKDGNLRSLNAKSNWRSLIGG